MILRAHTSYAWTIVKFLLIEKTVLCSRQRHWNFLLTFFKLYLAGVWTSFKCWNVVGRDHPRKARGSVLLSVINRGNHVEQFYSEVINDASNVIEFKQVHFLQTIFISQHFFLYVSEQLSFPFQTFGMHNFSWRKPFAHAVWSEL